MQGPFPLTMSPSPQARATRNSRRDRQYADDFDEAQPVCYAAHNRREPVKREKHHKNNILIITIKELKIFGEKNK